MRAAGVEDTLEVDRVVERFLARLDDPLSAARWKASFWSRFCAGDPPVAYLDPSGAVLATGSLGHRAIVYAEGSSWLVLLDQLQSEPAVKAITVPASVWPHGDRPGPGFRKVERLEHHLDLRFAPEQLGAPPPGYDVRPWDPAFNEAAAALLATVNQGPDGLFLTFPELPSAKQCEKAIERILTGACGPFHSSASGLAFSNNQLVGLTLVTLEAPGKALLFEVAVRLRHRGSGLARHLIDRAEFTLAQDGGRYLHFFTCAANRGANALFEPATATSRMADHGWIWLRPRTSCD